jgi:hypothetical protein
MGGVTVSSGTLSADALGYSFRAKSSESFYPTVGIIALWYPAYNTQQYSICPVFFPLSAVVKNWN